jgi:nitrite reductase (NADH) small subunit
MNQAPHHANGVTPAAPQMTHPQEGIFDLGSIEQIPPGQGRCFVAHEIPIAVFRFRDGRFFAIDNRCPHRGGPLSEGVVGTDPSSGAAAVVCPLHAYKFSLRDGRGLETEMQAHVYRVEIRDTRICVFFD